MVMTHHTKDKGDLGVAKVHADLVGKGFTVLFPATEHAPFDLVAYAAGEFHRLQVKYRSAKSRNGQQAGVLDAAAFRELPRAVTGPEVCADDAVRR
jgi:hypothetical protein